MRYGMIFIVGIVLMLTGCFDDKRIEMTADQLVEITSNSAEEAKQFGTAMEAWRDAEKARIAGAQSYTKGYICEAAVYDAEGNMLSGCESKQGRFVAASPMPTFTNRHDAAIITEQEKTKRTVARAGVVGKVLDKALTVTGMVGLAKVVSDGAGHNQTISREGNETVVNGQMAGTSIARDNISTITEEVAFAPAPIPDTAPPILGPVTPSTIINVGDGGVYSEGGVEQTALGDITDSAVALGGSTATITKPIETVTTTTTNENLNNITTNPDTGQTCGFNALGDLVCLN